MLMGDVSSEAKGNLAGLWEKLDGILDGKMSSHWGTPWGQRSSLTVTSTLSGLDWHHHGQAAVIHIWGRKDWHFSDASQTADRPHSSDEKWVCHANPGDLLYLPDAVWHKVMNRDNVTMNMQIFGN